MSAPDEDLVDALELAVTQILDGSPPGPLFASRVRRVVTETLRRRGLNASVETFDGGTRVRIGLRERQRVRYVVFSVQPT